MHDSAARDRAVRRVLWTEGAANLSVLIGKLSVGLATGSVAILSDAIHSVADLANNALALVATRLASAPPDREHPYGHRKFETLAVFGVATLLSVLAVEIALHAFERSERQVTETGWNLAVMMGVLAVNVAIATWEGRRARHLDSDILRADARHTFSDVLTTLAVIAGWQLAARGHAWLDTALALVVAALIFGLAFDLFRRAIPVLVDQSATSPEAMEAVVSGVSGVRETRRVRSRGVGDGHAIDVVVSVDGQLSTAASHAIADEVERALAEHFAVGDVSVHVEPDRHEPEKG